MTTATQSLTDRATEARLASERRYRERQEEERLQQARNDAAELKRLMKQHLDVDVDPASGEVEVDGLRFGLRTYRYDGHTDRWMELLETCAACGRDTGERVYSLAQLGQVLAERDDRDALPPHSCGEDEGDANHYAWVANQEVRKLAAVPPPAEKPLGERILEAIESIANVLEMGR